MSHTNTNKDFLCTNVVHCSLNLEGPPEITFFNQNFQNFLKKYSLLNVINRYHHLPTIFLISLFILTCVVYLESCFCEKFKIDALSVVNFDTFCEKANPLMLVLFRYVPVICMFARKRIILRKILPDKFLFPKILQYLEKNLVRRCVVWQD